MNPERGVNPFETALHRTPANYTPLTPLTFIERAAAVWPDHPSVIDGERRFTWVETYARCRCLASALARRGIGVGDCVAVFVPNVPAIYEASFGVPMLGAVLNTINVRLDPATIAFILEHGEAKALLTDRELSPVVADALSRMERPPLVIDVDDPPRTGRGAHRRGRVRGVPRRGGTLGSNGPVPTTNGAPSPSTTPRAPPGTRRASSTTTAARTSTRSRTSSAGTSRTIPSTCGPCRCSTATGGASRGRWRRSAGPASARARWRPARSTKRIAGEGVTHLCGAPVVLGMILNAAEDERRPHPHPVHVMTAAAPPPAAVLERMEQQGFKVTHVYGLTETYGPAVICAWKKEWDDLPMAEQAERKSRQGVRYHALDALEVMDPETMAPVPRDGETLGEVMFRGNIVMKGYLKNPAATGEAFAGGWFHSGDLGVVHPDGYIQLKDRSKDVIISGGENISSIEVEDALYRHPAVLEAAVVARPDETWGETPCAFVTLREGAGAVTGDDVIAFCRDHLARYKAPRTVVFGPLPKTSTGKVQKFKLRERAGAL